MYMNKPHRLLFVAAPKGGSYLFPYFLITSLFLLWGMAHGLLDVLNKHFQCVFTMSKAESGFVQFSTYIAYFLMALPAGALIRRQGYRKGIILGLLLFAIGAFGFIPAALTNSPLSFMIALFVLACGLCMLETAANPYSSMLGPAEYAACRLNLSQSFNGLGWILGPWLGGQLIFAASDNDEMVLVKPYIYIGITVLLVMFFFFFIKLPDINSAKKENQEIETSISLWHHSRFVHAFIAQFCYCAAQTGIFSFFINYVTELDSSIDNLRASRILAFGGMALFMLGRLSGSALMRWFTPGKLLSFHAFLSSCCMLLVIASVGHISLFALYLSFFFMSVMFPTIFALGLEGVGRETQKASSYLIMSVVGGAVSPLAMGYLGDMTMAHGFIIPLLSFLYILYFAIRCEIAKK